MKGTTSTPVIPDKEVRDYRKEIGGLNQSMLKVYRDDPSTFYRQFVLGEKQKEKDSWSINVGSVLDFILLECKGDMQEFEQRFSEQFALFEGIKSSAQVFVLADTLFDISKRDVVGDEICTEFECRFKEALETVQNDSKKPLYKGKTFEKALEDFNDNGKDYFNKKLENINKTIVDVSVVEKAKSMAENLLIDDFTIGVFKDVVTEYLPKLAIAWKYRCKDDTEIECKSEIDVLNLDHLDKKAYVRDLKSTYDNEDFAYTYLKYGYYIQNAFYHLAVRYWLDNNGMADYEIVEGMEFIVADTSKNNRRPLIYKTSHEDVVKGLIGFSINGHYYKGVQELMEAVNWSLNTGIFNISKENLDNNGVIELNINYDIR